MSNTSNGAFACCGLTAMTLALVVGIFVMSPSCRSKRVKAAQQQAIMHTASFLGSPVYNFDTDWQLHRQGYAFDAFAEQAATALQYRMGPPSWPGDVPLASMLSTYTPYSPTLRDTFARMEKDHGALSRDPAVRTKLIDAAKADWIEAMRLPLVRRLQTEVRGGIQARLASLDPARQGKWYPLGKTRGYAYFKNNELTCNYSLLVPKTSAGMAVPHPFVILLVAAQAAAQSGKPEADLAPLNAGSHDVKLRFAPRRGAELLEKCEAISPVLAPDSCSLAAYDVRLADHSFTRLALVWINEGTPLHVMDVQPGELVRSTEQWRFRK